MLSVVPDRSRRVSSRGPASRTRGVCGTRCLLAAGLGGAWRLQSELDIPPSPPTLLGLVYGRLFGSTSGAVSRSRGWEEEKESGQQSKILDSFDEERSQPLPTEHHTHRHSRLPPDLAVDGAVGGVR
jgi:hypothetical protein